MLARLGRVLNWLGWIIAVPFVALGVWVISDEAGQGAWFVGVMLLAVAAAAWGIGRAARYVLAGE